MTTVEQIALANEKVTHWRGKCEHAASILRKWEGQLAKLQAKAQPQQPTQPKPQATIDKVPLPLPKLVVENSAATVTINRKAKALQEAIDKQKADKVKPTPTKPKN